MDERFMGWSGGGGSRTIAQKSWLGKHERRPRTFIEHSGKLVHIPLLASVMIERVVRGHPVGLPEKVDETKNGKRQQRN